MRVLYMIVGLCIVAGYGYAEWRGLEIQSSKRQQVAHGLRGTQGGYRSYWYTGFHGGK